LGGPLTKQDGLKLGTSAIQTQAWGRCDDRRSTIRLFWFRRSD